MKRTRFALATLSLAGLVLSGCKNSGAGPDEDLGIGHPDGGAGHDMRGAVAACDPKAADVVDLAVAPKPRNPMPGDVGTACAQTTDCKQGPAPTCWKGSLFDKMGNLPTPGGYCSSSCAADADCGTGNLCVDFGAPEGKACISGCDDAVTCRKPGYVCFYLDQTDTEIITGCFPDGNLNCNPKLAACDDPVSGNPGGCSRQAIEDEHGGVCFPGCTVPNLSSDCGMDAFGRDLQCVYIDFTGGGDGFRGPLCFPGVTDKKALGDTCKYTNECEVDLECDDTTKKCSTLCDLKGGKPRCTGKGVCTQAFPTCELGLCRSP